MEFKGEYVAPMRDVLIASIISGQNALVVGPPGWGKSHILRTAAHGVVGEGATAWFEFEPSSPPELIRGAYNPAALLDGRIERVMTDTPYDPEKKVIIFDEFFRANDIIFDAAIHVCESFLIDRPERPVFWGTANHIADYERVAALRDRFAFWFYLNPDKMDVRGIVLTHLTGADTVDKKLQDKFPPWEECMKIRKIIPKQEQAELVADFIEQVVKEAVNNNFPVNPRRAVQWSSILHAYSVFENGMSSFKSLPKTAMKMLCYAYPSTTLEKAMTWMQAVNSMLDKEGAAITDILSNMKSVLEKVVSSRSALGKDDFNVIVIAKVQAAKKNLEIFESDPRVPKICEKLDEWSAQLLAGQVGDLSFIEKISIMG